jgi:putative SOS response-associated peptidase YedK
MSVTYYCNELGMPVKSIYEDLEEPIADYNVLPGVEHWTLRMVDGELAQEKIKWQYLSEYARQQGFAPAINAQIEKLLTPYYRTLMKTGRIIIPVDGWYEWVKEGKLKQPWYIKRKDGKLFSKLLFKCLSLSIWLLVSLKHPLPKRLYKFDQILMFSRI